MNFPAQRISRSLDEAQRNPGCPWIMNGDQALVRFTAHLCHESRASAGVLL